LLLEAFESFIENHGLTLLDCFLCIKVKNKKGKVLTFDEKLKKKCLNILKPYFSLNLEKITKKELNIWGKRKRSLLNMFENYLTPSGQSLNQSI